MKKTKGIFVQVQTSEPEKIQHGLVKVQLLLNDIMNEQTILNWVGTEKQMPKTNEEWLESVNQKGVIAHAFKFR